MGSVYLLGDSTREGIYKIGVTRGSIEKRIKKLQTGNSGEIYLVSHYETEHPFLMEKMLHTKYTSEKVLNEWFSLSFEEMIKFKEHCSEIQETINVLKEDNYFFQKKYGKK
jgi:hypothetical protein